MAEKRYAYTTILSTDSYLPGVLALFESIKRTNTKITEFVALVNQNIKKETINKLKENGIIVERMPKIHTPEQIRLKNKLFPHWNNTFDKFNIFNLTNYDKVVYLDSDIYVAENIDELFQRHNMSAVVAGKSFKGNKYWNELNSGVMVIEPKEGIREQLISKMKELGSRKRTITKPKASNKKFLSNINLLKLKDKVCKTFQGIGDQDILEKFWKWKDKPELHLDESFNVFANYADFYKTSLGINPKVYHFIGAKKPWALTPKEIANITNKKSKARPVEYEAFTKYKDIIYENASKSKAFFSIIIPMKNAEKDIINALESIKEQNYENIEVLVIDDDSKDNSKNSVKKFLKKNSKMASKIKLFDTAKGHRGPGAGRNVGLDNAKGDYILFLDADDKLNLDALNNISRAIALNPEADIFSLGYQLTRLDFNEKEIGTLKLNSGPMQESKFYQVGVNTAGQMWNVCARRSLYEAPNSLRFKENCKFEDLPTKVELFTRNKKNIKSVPHLTHTQFSRPVKSITGTLNIRDMKRLIEANLEIANIKPNVETRDKMYINARMAIMPVILGWLVAKSIHNKIDLYRQKKIEEKER